MTCKTYLYNSNITLTVSLLWCLPLPKILDYLFELENIFRHPICLFPFFFTNYALSTKPIPLAHCRAVNDPSFSYRYVHGLVQRMFVPNPTLEYVSSSASSICRHFLVACGSLNLLNFIIHLFLQLQC